MFKLSLISIHRNQQISKKSHSQNLVQRLESYNSCPQILDLGKASLKKHLLDGLSVNVVLLANEYPPFIFGGIGTFMKELAQGLYRMGANVTIISGYPASWSGKEPRCENEDGIAVYRLPYPNIPPRHTSFQLANLKRVSQIIEEVHPSIIHGQSGSTFPLLSRLKRNAPVVVTFHSSPQMEKVTSIQSVLRGGTLTDFLTYVVGYPAWSITLRKELEGSDSAITVSEALKHELLGEMGEKYNEKMHAIHNGVNVEMLDREYNETKEIATESEETILFAGRLFWRKGPLNMIKMACLLQREKSRFRIIIHGSGPLSKKIQTCIRSLGLKNVEFKGFTTRSQLMKSMRLAKFIAIPSIYEACPMTLLEGMCLGKIPLMLNLPFASELTESGKYGLIANDMHSLTTKLVEASNNANLDHLSTKIRVFARQSYDINKTANKYLDIYNELCL